MRGAAAAAVAILGLVAPAHAFDRVLLKDGRTIEGTLVAGSDPSVVRLKVKDVELPISVTEIEKTFPESLDESRPKSPEEQEYLKKGWVLFEGHWMSKTSRDEQLAKRAAADKAAVEDIKKRQNWKNAVSRDSTHFTVKSNADVALVADYIERLEEFYKYLGDEWGVKLSPSGKGGKLKIELHRNLTIGDILQSGFGFSATFSFESGDGSLTLYYDEEDPDSTLRDLYAGEVFLLNFFIDTKFLYPDWIRRGLADYYATTQRAVDGKFSFGTPQFGYVLELDRCLKESKLPKLTAIFDDQKSRWSYEELAVEWSFVHFLMESPKYGKAFRAFVGNLPNNKDAGIHPEVATAKRTTLNLVDPKLCVAAMEKRLGTTFAKLDQEWQASLAEDVVMTPDAYFLAGQSSLNKATDGGEKDEPPPEEQANRYVQTAFELYAKADAAGIKSGLFYRRYAELLRKGGIVEQGAKVAPRSPDGAAAFAMIQKAIALTPTNPFNFVEAAGDLLLDGPAQDLDKAAMYADVARIVAGRRDLFIKSMADEIYAKIEPAREKRRIAAAAAIEAAATDARRWFVAFYYVEPAKPPENLKDLTTQQVRDFIRSGKIGPEDSVFQSWRDADPATGELISGTELWDKAWVKVKDCPLFKDDLAAAPRPAAPAKPAGTKAPGAESSGG